MCTVVVDVCTDGCCAVFRFLVSLHPLFRSCALKANARAVYSCAICYVYSCAIMLCRVAALCSVLLIASLRSQTAPSAVLDVQSADSCYYMPLIYLATLLFLLCAQLVCVPLNLILLFTFYISSISPLAKMFVDDASTFSESIIQFGI